MAKLSIVIPTLNEEQYIRETITHTLKVSAHPQNLDIIVVDAGSTDNTIKELTGLPVRSFIHESFKGKKYLSLNFGLSQASGNYTLFLDADTLLPSHFDQKILSVAIGNIIGGAFDMGFKENRLQHRLLAALNRIRYRIESNYYGDQGVFCQTQIAKEIGGFPEKGLMESAYFCRRLKRHGKIKLIPERAYTSARRFDENGFFKVVWFDIQMWLRFILGLDVTRYAYGYWDFNDKEKYY